MRVVKIAVWNRIEGDPTIMNLLGQTPPYPGRVLREAPPSADVGRITYVGETLLARGSKEDQTLTLAIWAYSHDLVEDIAANLDRLFRPTVSRYWIELPVTEGRAFVRKEFTRDLPDIGSELWRKIYRLRIKFAWGAAA
jgi:hypothetical protein